MSAPTGGNDPAPTTGVPGQAGMARGVQVPRAYGLAESEGRRRACAQIGARPRHRLIDLGGGQPGRGALKPRRCAAGGDFLGGHQVGAEQQVAQRTEPFLVVGHRQIHRSGDQFALMAPRVDVATGRRRHRHGVDPTFPGVMKDRFVDFPLQRAEIGHAAHVVDTIHSRAVPIMPSRVTSAARVSSPRSSVSTGRCGKTR